jgi:hypothetical protein
MPVRFYRWFFYAIALEDLILGVAFFTWWKPLLDLRRMANLRQLSTRICRQVTSSFREGVTGLWRAILPATAAS